VPESEQSEAAGGDGGGDGAAITVVLADDHEIVREGIRMVLESEPDIEVVAEAGDAESAVRYALGHKPTVLVLDLNMPGGSGLDAIPQIGEASPDTRIVVLTMQGEPQFARTALQAGAAGYVIKHSAASELVDAIHTVIAGETYINPQLGARVASEPAESEGLPDGLTPREAEVLGLLALGYMNPEIAEKLVLSVRTVETHRANIQRKTDKTTRAELIAYALDNKLVER
jgi:two-component system response regulator NreC